MFARVFENILSSGSERNENEVFSTQKSRYTNGLETLQQRKQENV